MGRSRCWRIASTARGHGEHLGATVQKRLGIEEGGEGVSKKKQLEGLKVGSSFSATLRSSATTSSTP